MESYNNGWVMLHRRMLDWEWFHDAETLQLFIYCLLRANILAGRWAGIDYRKGEFITSLGKLSAETGQSVQQIRTRLNRLKSTGEITMRTTNKYTLITICKYGYYQPCRDVRQQSYQQDHQQSDSKQIANQQQQDNNITRQEDNTHTPVNTVDRGIARGKDSKEILDWISDEFPTIAAMPEPITEQNIVWMLRKYSVEDIKRIIASMHNKRAFENINAYATFINFAKYDKELAERRNATGLSGPKPYTWDEVLAYVDRHSGKATTNDFDRHVINGVPVWFKKSDLQSRQLAQR